jgi:transcriptional regulator with XRE-family HTH domain
MDIPLVIRKRLNELGLDQKDLARGVQVTESYISQLLTRKRTAPAPGRTDIYEKIGVFLKLPSGELSRLAELQRREDLRNKVAELPPALFRYSRELILRKCEAYKRSEMRRIFEKEPFSPLERFVTQNLLGAAKKVVRNESASEDWLRRLSQLSGLSYEHMRVGILDFLDVDVFNISVENGVSFLDPLIGTWDIELETFGMQIVLNRSLTKGGTKRFEFVEMEPEQPVSLEPALDEFLNDGSLRGDATAEEIEFLKTLKFTTRRPTALYYYRELQNLRDPLHFRPPSHTR